jgi:excinuclease ABC subunit A
MKCADWLIDLGPEGGNKGGHLVFAGTPEDMIESSNSYTAQYLKDRM